MGKASRRKRDRVFKNDNQQTKQVSALSRMIKRWKLFLARNKMIVRSCAIFMFTVGTFVLVFSWLVETDTLFALLSFTAHSAAFVLNLFGGNVEVSGSVLASDRCALNIVNECTAIIPMMILLCAIVAYPSRFNHKLLGLVLGLPLLFLLNLIRVVSLFYVSTYFKNYMDTAHLLIWQPLMILAVIAIWLIWASKVGYVRKT